MKTPIFFLMSMLFLSSCDKFDWHNPYDPECPKELFTPSSPGASMEGNSVKLTWSQSNDDISGFALYRSAEGEPIANLTQTQKSTTQYLDASITPGKKYTYYVLAVAGTNKSDTIKAEITPVFPITISTGAVTELAATSAKVSGNITSAGGGTVTSRGICWSTTQNPTVNNSKTTEGTGAGQYTSTLNGLLAGTTYYARAYGENSRGMVYGSQVTFTTLGPPTLTTTAVSNITATSATSGGTIISDGGSPITAKGVVWSTSPNPTIDLATKTNDGTGVGAFTSSLSNLITNTKYYIRAYATNIVGTTYGEEFSFISVVTLNNFNFSWTKVIDGNCINICKSNSGSLFLSRTTDLLSTSDNGLNWQKTNWPLGIVRIERSLTRGMSYSNFGSGMLIVGALDNGWFFSLNQGNSYSQSGPTGFGCASLEVMALSNGSFLATQSGFLRGIYKTTGIDNTSWVKKYSYSNFDPLWFAATTDESVIYAGGFSDFGGLLVVSNDKGESWKIVKTFSSYLGGGEIIGDTSLLFVEGNGKFYKSNFSDINNSLVPTSDLNSVFITNTDILPTIKYSKINNTIICLHNGINLSNNSGVNWRKYQIPGVTTYNNVNVIDSKIYIMTDIGLYTITL